MKTLATEPENDRTDPADSSRSLEIAQILLDRLKPRRRMAFVLRVIEGHSYSKVAEILGVPETTARVRVYRARTDLEKEFNKHLADLKGGSENE